MVGQRKCGALHLLEGPDYGRTSLRYDSGIRTHNLLTFCSRSMRSTFELQQLHKKRKDLGTKQKILPTSQERSSYLCFPFHSKLPNMGRQKPKKSKVGFVFQELEGTETSKIGLMLLLCLSMCAHQSYICVVRSLP